jgi:polyether ionophore transport system permease protein
MSPRAAVLRRALAQARVMTASFALIFAVYAIANVVGYRTTYPHQADRIGLARSFGTNSSLRMFYGAPHTLLTTSGYTEWRVGGFLAVVVAVFGLLVAVRATRSEEESGRLELVLAGCVTRGDAFAAAITATVVSLAAVVAVTFAALAVCGIPAGGAALLALSLAATGLVFIGVGALAGQVAATRRGAYTMAVLALGVAFTLRVAADTGSGLAWLRWTSPLGWAEETRPLTAARPAALALSLATAALLVLAAWLAARERDLGSALLRGSDTSRPRLALLGSVGAHALRDEFPALAAWVTGAGLFALVVGSLSGSVAGALTPSVRHQLAQLGASKIATPSGFLAFYFVFFVLAVSLLFCAQVAAARHEEAESRLETLLALPVGRMRWLGGRLAIAIAGGASMAITSGVLAWAGARANGVHVALSGTVEAGLNILPAGLLFLGLATLVYGGAPRAGAGAGYAIVGAAFLWELVGGLTGAPHWLLELTPFHHVGLVPIAPYPATAAAVMILLGIAAAAAGMWAFGRRDLAGA